MANSISVVVPMYKVEKWISACLESILNQSFTDFELILVNDGSPDRCGEIADDYAMQYLKIKVIHKQNGGLSSARNAGIDAATGKYIVFVDSDDQISNDYLQQLYQAAENNCNAVVCGFQTVPINQQMIPNFELNKIMNGRDFVLSSSNVHSNNDLCFTWRILFDLCLIKEKNLRFNEKVLFAEDTIFNLEFLLESERVCAIPNILYYYTVNNPESIMRVPYNQNLENSLNLQYQIKKHLSEKFNLFKNDRYRKDMADYYIKTIFIMMKNNLKNSPEFDKTQGLLRLINLDMFKDSIKEIGFSYKCDNVKEYLYYLAVKFKFSNILKREFRNV
ncbi:glycosyltransferase [Paenibacillus sp. GP183]|uniref:glycosyltransferase n=1 Tax=Paenibacillus sp. GP183 TaxID=1882751 RepID=UPI000895B647|nr:glycosyltransferase [Paenibacillus sp. GP183]SEC07344.1 glycosyltransferase EpsJ [Paenibacillus sp. GP183]